MDDAELDELLLLALLDTELDDLLEAPDELLFWED